MPELTDCGVDLPGAVEDRGYGRTTHLRIPGDLKAHLFQRYDIRSARAVEPLRACPRPHPDQGSPETAALRTPLGPATSYGPP